MWLLLLVLVLLFSLCWILGTQNVLRIPFLLFFVCLIFLEGTAYTLLRLMVAFLESLIRRPCPVRDLLALRQQATTYDQWKEISEQIDEYTQMNEWKEDPSSSLYDYKRVQQTLGNLRTAREVGDPMSVMQALLPCCHKNFCGTMKLELYWKTFSGTKFLIHDFYDEIVMSMDWLRQKMRTEQEPNVRQAFVRFSRHASQNYGKSALIMSGGATMGRYHIGLVRALWNEGFLPKVICGTSAGSIVASLVCSRSPEEFDHEINTLDAYAEAFINGPFKFSWLQRIYNALTTGYIYTIPHVFKHLSFFTAGDQNFQQSYEISGRHLCISASHATHDDATHNYIFNSISTPKAPLLDCVGASSSVPGLFPPVTINFEGCDTKFVDGCMSSDIPVDYVKELFAVNFAIVSQTNPHIIPFFYNTQGETGAPSGFRSATGGWRGGFFLAILESCLKEDLKKNCNLLEKFHLFPSILGANWVHLFVQRNEGDVTFVPKATIWEYFTLLENLKSKEELETVVRNMERRTWEKMPYIANRMRVENEVLRIEELALSFVDRAALRKQASIELLSETES